MEITSFYFLCFYAVLLVLYYLVPGKLQWIVLLLGSGAFYLLGGNGWLILYPLAGVTVTWLAVRGLERQKEQTGRRIILAADVLLLGKRSRPDAGSFWLRMYCCS